MTHAVFKVDRSKAPRINDVTSDEIVSRLSIVTRDSNILGLPGDCVYVLIEGRDEGIARAKELFEGNTIGRQVPAEVADQVQEAIRQEEDAAAEGMGSLFG